MQVAKPQFRCILHGSFRKHLALIQKIHDLFTNAGIEILAPKKSEIASFNQQFALLRDEENADPRLIELLYLHNLKKLGPNGFSYFVNPDGYVGRSTSYELGIAQLTNVCCFYLNSLKDHPAYLHKNSIWKPEDLAEYVTKYNKLPEPKIKRNEKILHKLWEDLMVPGSVVATGGIIEYKNKDKKEILLVKTHKWGGRYSIIGGKVRRNERLSDALLREIKEETGLKGEIGKHIVTFDQIKNSGYYLSGIQLIFVDNIVKVASKRVKLNDEAQDYVWITPQEALKHLPIEPNARKTVEIYNTLNGQI